MNDKDHTAHDSTTTAGRPDRRMMIEAAAPLHERQDQIWAALMDANDDTEPAVMLRDQVLVRMTDRGVLQPYDQDSLRTRVSRVAVEGAMTDDNRWKPKEPPRMDAINGLLARHGGEYPFAPHVERVMDAPALDCDGELVTEPGHHEASRVYLRPAKGLAGVAGNADLREDVEAARDFLVNDYLGDFQFADEASRAHALALLLLPFVRDAIPGGTPMHVILAPDIGSGKTTLAQACLVPGCGLVPAWSGTADDSEWRKRITAALIGGKPALLFDNLSGTLDSGSLAAALTTGVWSDRVLGKSQEVEIPVRNVWAATGNNLDMAPEQVRRAVPMFLEPGEVRPSDRPRDYFKHEDLLGWGLRNRRELVAASLTLVEHWRLGPAQVEAGYVYRRTGEDVLKGTRTMGSFNQWADVMGGILESCGVPGFLGNTDRLRDEADGKGQEITEFLAAVASLNLPSMATPDLVEALRGASVGGRSLDLYLPADLGSSTMSPEFKQRLEVWIRKNKESWHGGYRLTLDPEPHRRRQWQVIKSAAA